MHELRRRRVDPPAARSEKELADWALSQLSPWFLVDREVRGTMPSGKKLRIDAILTPRNPEPWKDEHPAIGVEFKQFRNSLSNMTKTTGWFAQSIDYAYTTWDGYGPVAVFMYPDPFGICRQGQDYPSRYDDPYFVLAHTLGQFKVGELMQTVGAGWKFVLHGHHTIWSERDGIEAGKRWSMSPRRGAR